MVRHQIFPPNLHGSMVQRKHTGPLIRVYGFKSCWVHHFGVSYNGSIRGLGPRGEGSTPSTPTSISSWRNGQTQTAQTRKSPGSNPGGDTKTPDTELAYGLNLKFGGCGFESHSGDQHSLVAEWHMRCAKNAGLVRVRLPPGLPNIRIAQEDSAPVF